MDDHHRVSGAVGNRYVQRLGIVGDDADILVRPLSADVPCCRDVREHRLTRQSRVVAGHRQADIDVRAHLDVLRTHLGPRRTVGRA